MSARIVPTPTPNAPSPANAEAVMAGIQRNNAIRQRLQQLAAFGGLLVIYIAFTIASPQVFPTWTNFIAILFSAVVIGCLGLGATFVILTGGIDLSCGTGMALCAVVGALMMVKAGVPVWIGVPLTLAFGAVLGMINGANVAYLKLPPFIATLAMMLVAQGMALVLSNSAPIYYDLNSSFPKISTGVLFFQIPNAVWVLILAAVIAGIVLQRTLLGRYALSIGSNKEATALSGINVNSWTVRIYAFAGLFTALAGIMISARLGSAQPATGAGYELQAIAAVVIGGTSLSGGKGSVLGTVIGALIISVLNNGLQIVSVPQQWQNIILGIVILLAVFADQIRTRRSVAS